MKIIHKNQARVKLITGRSINPNGSARIEYDNGESLVIDPSTREARTYSRSNNFLILKKEESMKERHWNLHRAVQNYVALAA